MLDGGQGTGTASSATGPMPDLPDLDGTIPAEPDRPTAAPQGGATAAAARRAEPDAPSTERIQVFVYGTLRRGYYNHARHLTRAIALGAARTVERYALYLDSVPHMAKCPQRYSIVGEAYEVDTRTLQVLDMLEGHPRWYRREELAIALESGVIVTAWAYLQPAPVGHLAPTGDYTEHCTPDLPAG